MGERLTNLEEMAQIRMGCKNGEEINLIRKIDNAANDLMQSLNSIEDLLSGVNKNLLPPKLEAEAKCEKDTRPPQGWFEKHLEILDFIFYRSTQIYNEVARLSRETKTDAK